MRKTMLIACVSGLLAFTGCTTYYSVTDPDNGKVYYTTEVHREHGGAVRIKDAATGDTVTLQNSRVAQVTEEEFKTNRAGKQ